MSEIRSAKNKEDSCVSILLTQESSRLFTTILKSYLSQRLNCICLDNEFNAAIDIFTCTAK